MYFFNIIFFSLQTMHLFNHFSFIFETWLKFDMLLFSHFFINSNLLWIWNNIPGYQHQCLTMTKRTQPLKIWNNWKEEVQSYIWYITFHSVGGCEFSKMRIITTNTKYVFFVLHYMNYICVYYTYFWMYVCQKLTKLNYYWFRSSYLSQVIVPLNIFFITI